MSLLDQNGFPRRNRIDLASKAETAIRDATKSVEGAGAHPLLTDAINLLHAARDKVADHYELPDNQERIRDDFVRNWRFRCDSDAFDHSSDFDERMEAAGFIELRPVTQDDLNESFAYDRGVEAGGNVWDLTEKGRETLRDHGE